MQVLVTGAAGRLGRMLRAAWSDNKLLGFDLMWSARQGRTPQDIAWDILSDPAPQIGRNVVVLHLAGVLRGDSVAMAANAAMARNICAVAKSVGAAHVFLASSAAVYGRSDLDHVEVQAPAPRSAYGHAKLAMERDALSWAQDAGPDMPGVTCLRIGNVLGADALFAGADRGQPTLLDPVPGTSGGPVRSYIGPQALAGVLADLVARVRAGSGMPKLLNIAAPGAVRMADLLDEAQIPYSFGPLNPHVTAKVSLSTKRLASLVPILPSDASRMVADWRGLKVAAA